MPKTTGKEAGSGTGPEVIHLTYELVLFALVLLSVANSFLWLFLRDPAEAGVVRIVQSCIYVILLCDAFYRLARTPLKRRFLIHRYGWLYFVGSLPLPFICLLRLIPFFVAIRRLRRVDYQAMGVVMVGRRAQSTLAIVAMLAVVFLEAGSILMLSAEKQASNANIQTASDALWWSIVTIATVGYGDRYPVTNEGRIVGILVIVVGVALFTSLTSFLANWFLRQRASGATPLVAPDRFGEMTLTSLALGADTSHDALHNATGSAGAPDGSAWPELELMREMIDRREVAHRRELQELRDRLAALSGSRELPPTAQG